MTARENFASTPQMRDDQILALDNGMFFEKGDFAGGMLDLIHQAFGGPYVCLRSVSERHMDRNVDRFE